MALEEGGLRSTGPDGETFVRWNGISSVDELAGQILIRIDDFSFIPMSASAFFDEAERAAVLADLRNRTTAPLQGATNPVSIFETAKSTADEGAFREAPSTDANVLANVVQGIRLAVFLRPDVDRFQAPQGSWSTLVALVFLSIAIPFIAGLVQAGSKGSFSASALPGVLFVVPVSESAQPWPTKKCSTFNPSFSRSSSQA